MNPIGQIVQALQAIALALTGPSGVVQTQSTNYASVATGPTIIPIDNTIPQITEGDLYMTQAITPKAATNILEITATMMLANNAANPYIAMALFIGTTANAIAAICEQTTQNSPVCLTVSYEMVAGVTTPLSFTARAGGGAAGTTTFNGQVAGQFFGGATISRIKVTERKP